MSDYKIIEYQEKYGSINCPEGFLEQLKGLSIEEQLKHYKWVWKHIEFKDYPEYIEQLKDKVACVEEETVIMKDGIVVGVYLYSTEQYPGHFYMLPFKSITYYCIDNNGAGYKESTSERSFICWPDTE